MKSLPSLHDAERVDATMKRSNVRWVAIRVDRSGGGGNHGGGH